MKRSITLFALCAAIASLGAHAAPPSSPAAATQTYHYGMPVDVAKVISITPASNAASCEVGTAHMVYVDHQGNRHELDYQEMGNCSQQ